MNPKGTMLILKSQPQKVTYMIPCLYSIFFNDVKETENRLVAPGAYGGSRDRKEPSMAEKGIKMDPCDDGSVLYLDCTQCHIFGLCHCTSFARL